MFRTTSDFLTAWNEHIRDTEKVFQRLTDGSLSQSVSKDHRTLGRLGWHIVLTNPSMMREAGMTAHDPAGADVVPERAAVILDGYRKMSEQLSDYVRIQLADGDLLEAVPMYGESWTRGQVLFAIMAHEIHHRGQMTVLMRQAGLAVPGVYGPAREEWSQFGMPEPAI
jgi:uncharacterized damage-inducible protein DinB